MKPNYIEHIGIAVDNLQESIKYYEDVLGMECYAIEEVTDQKVKTAFLWLAKPRLNYWSLPTQRDP
jgi:methylmalonyl-CoA/ethylmalonyl-CoA epimerase